MPLKLALRLVWLLVFVVGFPYPVDGYEIPFRKRSKGRGRVNPGKLPCVASVLAWQRIKEDK